MTAFHEFSSGDTYIIYTTITCLLDYSLLYLLIS